ncbi:hypothetical protein [Endozoicomonas atrinae]|uniref:hypothetical protein n=1 Tax=Endozoicomonas atrinae TaxID=1333660 RepID=UPI003AFF9668
MEKAWAIIIDDDQAACMMAIPRLFEQLQTFTCNFLFSLYLITSFFCKKRRIITRYTIHH